jgi:hypothetical protein
MGKKVAEAENVMELGVQFPSTLVVEVCGLDKQMVLVAGTAYGVCCWGEYASGEGTNGTEELSAIEFGGAHNSGNGLEM